MKIYFVIALLLSFPANLYAEDGAVDSHPPLCTTDDKEDGPVICHHYYSGSDIPEAFCVELTCPEKCPEGFFTGSYIQIAKFFNHKIKFLPNFSQIKANKLESTPPEKAIPTFLSTLFSTVSPSAPIAIPENSLLKFSETKESEREISVYNRLKSEPN